MSSPFAAINHIGFVVTSLDEGLAFCTEVLGFMAVVGRSGEITPDSDLLTRRFGISPDAAGRFAFVELNGQAIELLQWTAPDQNQISPSNSDLGGRHLAITVSDMPAALARLGAAPGVTIREPNDAGYIYCATPFGLEVQLIPGKS